MTSDEAEAMLKELAKHYGERVAPVSRYCEALDTWARVMRESEYGTPELLAAIGTVKAWLFKSNLAARLVYGGEPLRTRKCPKHDGHWSGCVWPKRSEDACACMSGCNVTGWLPEEPTP